MYNSPQQQQTAQTTATSACHSVYKKRKRERKGNERGEWKRGVAVFILSLPKHKVKPHYRVFYLLLPCVLLTSCPSLHLSLSSTYAPAFPASFGSAQFRHLLHCDHLRTLSSAEPLIACSGSIHNSPSFACLEYNWYSQLTFTFTIAFAFTSNI